MNIESDQHHEAKLSLLKHMRICVKYAFYNYPVQILVTIVFLLWMVIDWHADWEFGKT